MLLSAGIATERERERETETETETERQRETERETETERDRQTDRQTETDRQRQKETERGALDYEWIKKRHPVPDTPGNKRENILCVFGSCFTTLTVNFVSDVFARKDVNKILTCSVHTELSLFISSTCSLKLHIHSSLQLMFRAYVFYSCMS